MLFTASVTVLFSVLVSAQNYGGPAPGPTTTAAAAVPTAPPNTPGHVNINVAPSATSFVFTPNNVTAPNGTSVTFWFANTGVPHSVTQSSFQQPCTYLAASSNNTAGFDSSLTQADQFTIVITDESQPIWFHCKQVMHCGMGMVGSINAPTNGSNTFAAFQAAAEKIGSAEVQETSTAVVTGGFNAVASVGPSATGVDPTPSSSGAMRIGVSAGAALLGAVMLAALA